MIRIEGSTSPREVRVLDAMRKPRRLYIDTNIVGEIAFDADRESIIQEMRRRFDVRIGVLVIAEISCIKDRRERCRWLDTARRVTGGAKNPPFDDPRSITRHHIASFARGDTNVDPFIDRRDEPKTLIWELLKNPESMTERQHLTFREIKDHAEQWFHKIMDEMRPRIQGLRDENGDPFNPGHLTGFLRTFRRNEAFLRDEIANIVRTTPFANKLSGREIEILLSHNLWPYFLAAMGAGCYNRAFRTEGHSRKRHAGGVDTWQTIYLAFSDIFVTNDVAFRRLLRLVRRYSVKPHHSIIWSYSDLLGDLGIQSVRVGETTIEASVPEEELTAIRS